jgi:hypothetical protein
MVKIILYLLLFLFGTSVPQSYGQWRNTEWSLVDGYDVQQYVSRITGKFATTQQHLEEPYFDDVTVETYYFRDDIYGKWLYTEQSNTVDTIPYRRRIYLISWLNDTTIVSKVYQLPSKIPTDYKSITHFLSDITFDDIRYMNGCDIYIRKGIDSNYYGEISIYECKGTFRGANYTTSEFRAYSHMVVSWERGWKYSGEQVWGSSRGFYYYRRICDEELYTIY